MKLKVIQNRNASRVFINFGKNSQIRLRLPVVEWLSLQKGDWLLLATDEDDKKGEFLYFVKSDKQNDYRGFKVSNGNGAHHISGKSIVDLFKLKVPIALPYEMIEHEGVKYIKVILNP